MKNEQQKLKSSGTKCMEPKKVVEETYTVHCDPVQGA